MLRPFILVLSIALLVPLAGATPSASVTCADGSAGCVTAGDPGTDNPVAAFNWTIQAPRDSGSGLPSGLITGSAGPKSSDGASRNVTFEVDAQGPTVSLKVFTPVANGDTHLVARNLTSPGQGDPDFDLSVCCGDLDGDGKGEDAACRAATRNVTFPSGDPDFDLRCAAGPVDPIGASCRSGDGSATPTCVTKWKIYAPLPGGFATTSREPQGDTSAGVVVFAGGAAAGCFVSAPAPGAGQPTFFCFP